MRLVKVMPIKMPKIPRVFIDHKRVKLALYHVIDEFGYEEKIAIYYYCFAGLSIENIALMTELTQEHVTSVLTLYSERLSSKLDIFEKALPYNQDDVLHVSHMLALQF